MPLVPLRPVALAALLLGGAGGCVDETTAPAHEDRRRGDDLAPLESDEDAARAGSDARALRRLVKERCPEGGFEAYGVKRVKVEANGYWKSAGVWLEPGETARVTASGTWTLYADETAPFDADGLPSLGAVHGCAKGALVATVGLAPAARRHCVGTGAVVRAEKAGILYLGMNAASDPSFHAGELEAVIESDAKAAPSVAAKDAATFDYCASGAPWVEVWTPRHGILTVPAALADSARASLPATLARLDAAAKEMRALAGVTLWSGHRVRILPTFDLAPTVWMEAGNPLRIDPKNLVAAEPSRLALLEIGTSQDGEAYELLRALGVAHATARMAPLVDGDAARQGWGGALALAVMQALDMGLPDPLPCAGAADHEERGSYAELEADGELQACLVATVAARVGWEAVGEAIASLPETEASWRAALKKTRWRVLRDALRDVAPDEDVDDVFRAFHAPLD